MTDRQTDTLRIHCGFLSAFQLGLVFTLAVWLMCECRYEEQLEKFCKLMDFVIDSPPPELRQLYHASMVDRMKDKVDKSVFWSKLLGIVMQQGQKDMV